MGGGTFLKDAKKFATHNADQYGHQGGGKELIDGFTQAFGEPFDSKIHDITNYIGKGELTLADIKMNIIPTTEAIFPMPVLMIATYNEDGTVDVMNAGWGMMLERDYVVLNLTETHKTVKNIKNRKAFTVSIADANHVVEADYFGVVSGNNTENKFENSGLTATKSELVDAPIINEFPVCMECEFVEYQDDEYGCGVVGKVVNVTADEKVMTNDQVDITKVNAIAFDPYTHGYYKVSGRVGEAFKDGLKLKK